MTARDDALAELRLNVAPEARPVLSNEDLGILLDRCAIIDADGLPPSDTDWSPTYDVNAASARAWRVKAGRVAGDFNFSADGASYSKADVLANCLEMEGRYAAMSNGILRTVGPSGVDLDLIARTVIP